MPLGTGVGRAGEKTDDRTLEAALLLPFLPLSGPELSDTKVYEPYIRALLGTAPHFCSALVLLRCSARQWGTSGRFHPTP